MGFKSMERLIYPGPFTVREGDLTQEGLAQPRPYVVRAKVQTAYKAI